MTPPSQGGEESTTAALASLRTRQEHREAAALSLSGLDGHPAAMGLRDAAHDRKAEARAAPFPIRLGVGLEDVRERVRGDAHASVLDLQLELRPGVDHPHDHAAAGRSEPDRVGAEVHEHLVETLHVAAVGEARADALALERHARFRPDRVALLYGLPDQHTEVEQAPLELHETGLQP